MRIIQLHFMSNSKEYSQIESFLENIANNQFGRSRAECFEKNICVKCGIEVTEFKDELSKKEYSLSGFCQKCQDDFFN